MFVGPANRPSRTLHGPYANWFYYCPPANPPSLSLAVIFVSKGCFLPQLRNYPFRPKSVLVEEKLEKSHFPNRTGLAIKVFYFGKAHFLAKPVMVPLGDWGQDWFWLNEHFYAKPFLTLEMVIFQ